MGFIGCFLKQILLIGASPEWGTAYPLYISLSTIYSAICLGGLMVMRRWAVWAFGAYLVIHQVVFLQMGRWDLGALLLAGAIFLTSLFYYRRMK